uniref:Uncharacterized protein n=1 Tax=Coccolithus braarudii TaxID=221442 RepID=A0A7S0L6X2_9EUKA|mmetsp:Transcript_22575/g.48749  ORF Transcript_22575/g.48749 Transcript_22575/m.48749 type:complete len:142 (+) Transcript_22575:143-568(+)
MRCAHLPALTRAMLAPALALCIGFQAHSIEPDSQLVTELLRRTEVNKVANDAAVRRITQRNAFTAVEGEPGMPRLVVNTEGDNVFLDSTTVARMTREGRMARGVGEPIRIVDREVPMDLELPRPRLLECSPTGRDCKFREE